MTILLNGLALALMVAVALPMGAASAQHPGSSWDRLSAAVSYALYAVPVFWAALLLQILFSVELAWLPLAGWRSSEATYLDPWAQRLDRAAHLVLPVISLSYAGLAYLTRFVRASLLDSPAGESWRGARARGLSSLHVLYRHGLRQAGLPLLTLAGFMLPALFGGSVIVETTFALPGLGLLLVEAAFQRDTPVLMGLTLLSGVATLAGIVLADLAYGLLDPRVRRG
jgi:peptide/nickel transport system permease protein